MLWLKGECKEEEEEEERRDHVSVAFRSGDIKTLELETMSQGTEFAFIRWRNFNVTDPRELLSWVVNFRKAYADDSLLLIIRL